MNLSFHLREPVNGLTHGAGAVLSAVGLVLLVRTAAARGSSWAVVGFVVFGTSLVLLYTASALYHLLPLSARGTAVLRRIDHSMIYVLIAGTYSPIFLGPLRGPWGWSLFALVWAVAAAGIVTKMLWFDTPRWLTVLLYVAFGNLVFPLFPLLRQVLPAGAFLWIGIGGLFYLVGALFYGLKWPRLAPGRFGFHELWHLFVMAGSFGHFWAIWRFVTPR